MGVCVSEISSLFEEACFLIFYFDIIRYLSTTTNPKLNQQTDKIGIHFRAGADYYPFKRLSVPAVNTRGPRRQTVCVPSCVHTEGP